MENRFNDLSAKEWLPFQKSFSIFKDKKSLIRDNLRFFTKPSLSPTPIVTAKGSSDFERMVKTQAKNIKISYSDEKDISSLDLICMDITHQLNKADNFESVNKILDHSVQWIKETSSSLNMGKFIWILAQNVFIDGVFFPAAWELSNRMVKILCQKDEKIICLPDQTGTLVSLYFRKDHRIGDRTTALCSSLQTAWIKMKHIPGVHKIPEWFILKPKPRKKQEIQHPAKYPEELVRLYLENYTKPNNIIFDPMTGTGTTQVEALKLNREAYGIELSSMFHHIASERCTQIDTDLNWEIVEGDARKIKNFQFPKFDYVITSPPYWDMLNMKGAETQANRHYKGLKTNYSDDKNDLGNLSDYKDFIAVLSNIYIDTIKCIKPDGYMTIVVKNVKKKGEHYPLASDLTEQLLPHVPLVHVAFWCQDDLKIAPYGYKHTWVSNTFHHYCLTFKKPA